MTKSLIYVSFYEELAWCQVGTIMTTMKALVLSQGTRLPIAIQECIQVGGTALSVHVSEAPKPADIARLLTAEAPNILVIDGNYGLLDGKRWKVLSKLDENALRVMLLNNDKAEIPESLRLVRYAHALKTSDLKIIIFIDSPSDAVVEEVKRLGATKVVRSLTKLTPAEASFFELVRGGKELVSSGKKVVTNLSKIALSLLRK